MSERGSVQNEKNMFDDDYQLTAQEELKCEEAFAALVKDQDIQYGQIFSGDLKILMQKTAPGHHDKTATV